MPQGAGLGLAAGHWLDDPLVAVEALPLRPVEVDSAHPYVTSHSVANVVYWKQLESETEKSKNEITKMKIYTHARDEPPIHYAGHNRTLLQVRPRTNKTHI